MTQRSLASGAAAPRPGPTGDLPAPDVVAFIRYCHARRGASWPELYDEMCGVAARREFNGWDHAQLAARPKDQDPAEPRCGHTQLRPWTRASSTIFPPSIPV